MTTTDTTSAETGHGRSGARELARRVLTAPTVGPLIALVLTMAFFSLKSDRFLQAQNLSLVLQQVMVVGVLAIGQTLVILTAGIDLSVGTVMALGQIVMTKLAVASGVPPLPAIAARDPDLRRLRGPERRPRDARAAAGVHRHARHAEHRVRADPHRLERPDLLGAPERAALLRPDVHGRRAPTSPTASSSCSCSTRSPGSRSRQTAWGRHVYAVGDNPEAARLTGHQHEPRPARASTRSPGSRPGSRRCCSSARTELGDPNAGQTTENLDSITAVVLGGTSLFGGRGSIIGTLIGAVIVGVFRNGLTLIGVEVIYQYLVTGVLVILAVSVDQLTHRRQA